MKRLLKFKEKLEAKGYEVGIAEFEPGMPYLVATKGNGTTLSYWPRQETESEFIVRLKKLEGGFMNDMKLGKGGLLDQFLAALNIAESVEKKLGVVPTELKKVMNELERKLTTK